MADQYSNEGSSTSNVSGESSDSIVELNIKTLDSRIYSFQADKNMPVSFFKEKIANEIGVPVGQQRLIFRGKVLKDDHLLSEYHVENGHTLHLVERQPAPSQPSSDTRSGETNGNNGIQGNEASAGAPRNRVGQISHSVVLGTFNVGEQGEGIVPDLSRVIGAVLNSFGIGSQTATNGASGTQSSTVPNAPGQTPQGNETDGLRGSVGGQNQAGNQTQHGQTFPGQPFQSPPEVLQFPMTAAAAIPVPSLHAPIPDSLNTLSEFMNRMQQALSQNGYQLNTSSTSTGDLPRVELPADGRGLPTPEALGIVMRHAQQLLSGHAIPALSHLAGRLEQEGGSSDPNIRGQIQTESVQVGFAVQHLGALLLELGRTILTLRMGQSPAESSVNAGPAVYISQSRPNPIMVQPFPLQTNSLLGGSVPPSNPMTFGPLGVGNAPRHINIHIHAGTSLAPVVSAAGTRATSGEGLQGERNHGTGSASARVLPMRNVIAAAVPSRPTGGGISSSAQPGIGVSVSQPPSDSVSLSSVLAEVNSRIRNFVGNMQEGSHVSLGQMESNVHNSYDGSGGPNDLGNEPPHGMTVDEHAQPSASPIVPESDDQKVNNNEDKGSVLSANGVSTCSAGGSLRCSSGEPPQKSEDTTENASSSSEKHDLPEGAKAIPLGLGLGGLDRKRRSRQPKSLVKNGDGGTTGAPLDQNLNTGRSGQQLLRSVASRSLAMNNTDANDPSGDLPSVGSIMEGGLLGGQGSDGQFDAAGAMSQVLHSPALNGLLAGVSEQTGVGSPDVLRNMLQQLTQSPQVMNTVNQIAQQVDGQELGNMFSGLGGQGGGIDLSRMMQQMMPVVSRALSRGSSTPQPFPAVEPERQPQYDERSLNGADRPSDQNFQIDLQQVAQQIEHCNAPGDVFRTMVDNAGRLNGSGGALEDLMDELCSNEGLASEYMEMLRRDVHHRLQGEEGQDKC